MTRLQILDTIVLTVLVIGGLNWGLVGLFEFDLVAAIFGAATIATRTIYTLVGISAVYTAAYFLPRLMRLERAVAEDTSHREEPRLRKVA